MVPKARTFTALFSDPPELGVRCSSIYLKGSGEVKKMQRSLPRWATRGGNTCWATPGGRDWRPAPSARSATRLRA
jgi:hypothetical protein